MEEKTLKEPSYTVGKLGTFIVFGVLTIVLVFAAEQMGGVLQAALTVHGIIGGPMLGGLHPGDVHPICEYLEKLFNYNAFSDLVISLLIRLLHAFALELKHRAIERKASHCFSLLFVIPMKQRIACVGYLVTSISFVVPFRNTSFYLLRINCATGCVDGFGERDRDRHVVRDGRLLESPLQPRGIPLLRQLHRSLLQRHPRRQQDVRTRDHHQQVSHPTFDYLF
ncbi:hypothetical protein CEXT_361521 [Caerostris extrusa]|uniref:Uncharacterized protein n=1 Tax=Caerostris extrusa TaxID=172846 RepID=A0AAV4WG37_CAEEX|nr:hypothetical protein CEXT_361521 [Caerostris extrusa]